MRTVKASEVVKGMRVQVESIAHNVHVSIVGDVCEATHSANTSLTFEDGTQKFYTRDHPVTVLAEPEPEWVEGAWYWVDNGPMIRRVAGWYAQADDTSDWPDVGDGEHADAPRRVLIVDWPGDGVARVIESVFEPTYEPSAAEDNRALKALADAIRTQGGVR